jgi:TolB-like protein/class 3 adenylate cyclase
MIAFMKTERRERVERHLAAILAADVAGYSRLMGADEEGTLAALKSIRREVSDPKVKEHRGRIVKTTGDGLLIEFASVVDAVRCAVDVQREMAERNAAVPVERRIELRIGINLGDIIKDGRDIFGDGVNVAARLEALAEPGGICVSRVVRDQVRDKFDIAFEDMGEQQVKNIARPIRVYRIPIPGAHPLANPPLPAGEERVGALLPLPEKPSLAVLPFQNMTGDTEQDYFVDGIVEEITTAISRLPWLFVIARNSSFTYKGKAVDVKQVARELGVRYVLEGSVRKAGNRVRITGQLIDTATGAHIWADRFDGTLDDIFELQDEIASGVAAAIEPKLRQAEIERASRKPTDRLDAYDLYLRARALVYKRTRESLADALGLAHRALQLDATYAPAMGMVGQCRVLQRVRHWIPTMGPEADEGIRMTRQALECARDDSDVLWVAGYSLAYLAGEGDTGLDAIDRAIVLNPNSANAFGARALVLAWLARSDEAILAARQAKRLSPLDPLAYHSSVALGFAHMAAGRYEEAVPWADQAFREGAGIPALRFKLSLCGHLGLIEQGRECFQRLREVYPQPTIAAFRDNWPAFSSLEFIARYIEGLRKAGVPEE